MNLNVQLALMLAGIILFLPLGMALVLSTFYKKVPQGKVWIRSGVGGSQVSFGGIVFIPILHRLEQMDITAKKIELRHFGDKALRTKDGVYLDAQVGIVLRIEPTTESILYAAQTHGALNASNQAQIEKLFCDRFEEGLVASVRQFNWNEIDASLEPLKEEYFERICDGLLGFVIDDISFGHLSKPGEQTEQRIADKTQVFQN
jgi:uncharacterized membrane protein YqiK